MNPLPDFEAWAIFAKVAETGSFARAAEQLGLAKPTVSKAITRLETRLGATLIHRTSRRISLTESGRGCLARATRILDEGEAVEAEVSEQSSAPRGVVRMAAPMSFGIQHVGPALPDFLIAYPDITIDLSLSDERVDLVGGGFDLALRIASLEDSTLLARKLCGVRVLLVGSPGYFARRGRPVHPRDLKGHVGLGYTAGASRRTWNFHHAAEADYSVDMTCQVWTNNADILNPALLAGVGLALQPEFLVWRELRQGLLETAMSEWSPPPIALHLVTPPSPVRPARVQALIAYLSQRFTEPPWATESRGQPVGAAMPTRQPAVVALKRVMDHADLERLKSLEEELAQARTMLDTLEVGGNLGTPEGLGPMPDPGDTNLDELRDRVARLEQAIAEVKRHPS